ncbi:MAG: YcxB family protein [Gelidibacter sp.]
MIQTKPYALSKSEYAKIVLKTRLKKSWWLLLVIFICGFAFLKNFGKDSFSTFFTIFGFAYPFIVIIWIYIASILKKNNYLFQETEMAFDNEFLYFKKNGNESKIPSTNILKVVSTHLYWLLYLSKEQFIYVEKDIFFTPEDYNIFCSLIIDNK